MPDGEASDQIVDIRDRASTDTGLRSVNRPAGGRHVGRTLTEEAYHRLEEMIVTLELGPGELVSESILSKKLDIGTTPIREALQRLARDYLVRILPRRGVVVTSVDVRLQMQVLETRRELDRLTARLAARRGSPAQLAAFAELAGEIERATPEVEAHVFLRLDAEMNRLAAEAARNRITSDALSPLHALSRRFWFYYRRDFDDYATTAQRHADLARAISTGDEDAAAAASDRLLDHLVAFAKATLPEI